jgi:DNA-binding MarR family transcriptional regulator
MTVTVISGWDDEDMGGGDGESGSLPRDLGANGPDAPAGAGLRPPEDRLAYLLYRLGRAVGHAMDRAMAAFELHPAQFGVLNALASHGPMHQQRLAALLGVNRQTMATAAADLARRGLIERRRRLEDRRALDLHLTPTGQALLERADPDALALDDRLFTALDASEQHQLVALLQQAATGPEFTRLLRPQGGA